MARKPTRKPAAEPDMDLYDPDLSIDIDDDFDLIHEDIVVDPDLLKLDIDPDLLEFFPSIKSPVRVGCA